MKSLRLLAIAALFFLFVTASIAGAQTQKPVVGVTMHAYYSWVNNIGKDAVKVVAILPSTADPHSYQPRPADIEKLTQLDAIVINDQGHDSFIRPMLKAAGVESIPEILPNQGVPLIESAIAAYAFEENSDEPKKVAHNSHTHISIIAASQQINTITNRLIQQFPEQTKTFKQNRREYVKRLRGLLRDAMGQIEAADKSATRIATVHDGYAYMMRELGLDVAAVIQPRHGIEPNPRQLTDTIKRIKQANINVLFGELDYQKKYVDIIFKETGCRVFQLSHVSGGPYTADKFETDMKSNLDTVVKAITGGSNAGE
jgi:zinc transport system substrate-binding protein